MKIWWGSIKLVGSLLMVSAIFYVLYTQASPLFTSPCSEPIPYEVTLYDARFGISEAEFNSALDEAAALWNEAGGKELLVEGTDGIRVQMLYGKEQQASALSGVLTKEQQAIEEKRVQVEELRTLFENTQGAHEKLVSEFEKAKNAYETQVAYWNAQGGAPSDEYEALQAEAKRLEQEAKRINAYVEQIASLQGELNTYVAQFNELVRTLNARVDDFNEHTDSEFNQGRYIAEGTTREVHVYEFATRSELVRVLAHEFGHALGIGHVENSDSIMYSYNLGEDVALSAEDTLALQQVCALE